MEKNKMESAVYLILLHFCRIINNAVSGPDSEEK